MQLPIRSADLTGGRQNRAKALFAGYLLLEFRYLGRNQDRPGS